MCVAYFTSLWVYRSVNRLMGVCLFTVVLQKC